MAKIQIVKVSVLNLEYKGKRTSVLSTGCHYVAVAVEGFTEENRSEVRLEFQNGDADTIIYDSFVAFAEDWSIIGQYQFKDCFIPDKCA